MKSKQKNHVVPAVIVGILVLLYLFVPLDFIPDYVYGVGALDDALVLIGGAIFEIVNLISGISGRAKKEKVANSTYEEDRQGEFGSFKEL